MKRVKKRYRTPDKWKDTFYVKAYRLAKEGMKDIKIAAALGVTRATFLKWRRERKALRIALKQARNPTGSKCDSFREYVTGRLPSHLKPLWDDITGAEMSASPEKRIEAILSGQGKEIRQHLFVHAFVDSNFNKAEACRKANVGAATLRTWMSDPFFVDLMDQVSQMKKEFVDANLMNLIAQGDTSATIFASKTLNRDMGYDNKQTIEHVGQVSHHHLNFESLPLALRMQILAHLDKTGENGIAANMLPAHDDTPDAEFEELPDPDEVEVVKPKKEKK